MLNQTGRGLQRSTNVVFLNEQFIITQQPLISCIDEVIQYFGFRTSGDANEARKFFVAKPPKALRDVCRTRAGCLAHCSQYLKSRLTLGRSKNA